MKRAIYLTFVVLICMNPAMSQPERIGAGLSFANKRSVNVSQGETGNPGLVIRTWIPLNKTMTIHLIPAIAGYNPQTISNNFYLTTGYMFTGDVDVQFRVFHDKTLKLVAFTGVNYTWIFTRNKQNPDITFNLGIPENDEFSGFGPSAGAALEMRMSPFIDFILSGKYTYSFMDYGEQQLNPISVPIIQIQAVYYFQSRGRGYYKK